MSYNKQTKRYVQRCILSICKVHFLDDVVFSLSFLIHVIDNLGLSTHALSVFRNLFRGRDIRSTSSTGNLSKREEVFTTTVSDDEECYDVSKEDILYVNENQTQDPEYLLKKAVKLIFYMIKTKKCIYSVF
ncbi:hypothetical protein Avbf_01415 [Armadillidium vulgare]|nr:hypothetical protein Avbf_01415 [Armadillidium vulgare]